MPILRSAFVQWLFVGVSAIEAKSMRLICILPNITIGDCEYSTIFIVVCHLCLVIPPPFWIYYHFVLYQATPTVVTAITSNSSGGVHGESATASDGNTEATSALPRSHALDGSGALRIEAGDRAARLLRLIEAVRALGLACGD